MIKNCLQGTLVFVCFCMFLLRVPSICQPLKDDEKGKHHSHFPPYVVLTFNISFLMFLPWQVCLGFCRGIEGSKSWYTLEVNECFIWKWASISKRFHLDIPGWSMLLFSIGGVYVDRGFFDYLSGSNFWFKMCNTAKIQLFWDAPLQ